MHPNRILAIIFFFLGGFMVYINYTMKRDGGFYLRKFDGAGMMMLTTSIVLFLFPGSKFVKGETPMDFEKLWKATPRWNKVLWGVAAAVGYYLSETIL